MRKSMLKKNVAIKFHYWKPCVGNNEQLSMSINDIEICVFNPKCVRIIETIFNHRFVDNEYVTLVATTFQLDKCDLYINGTYVCDFDYKRLWLSNEAFAPITSYSIHINKDNLKWTYSWSQDWHIENHSCRVEDIENIEPNDLNKVIAKITKKYLPQVTHNSYFAYEIIEYRGKEFNRHYDWGAIGHEQDNFDEEIRKKIFKKD